MKQSNTVEDYIEGPRKPVLQEKQVFLVLIRDIGNAPVFSLM